MKFALAQLNFHIGNFSSNSQKIIQSIHEAREKGADFIVFPELAISGYPPRDFLDFTHFVECCLKEVEEIAKHCIGISAIVGGPSFNKSGKGKKLFNTAFVLANGKILSEHQKMLLPNYDVFDEYRYFQPAYDLSLIEINGEPWALTICEDIWEFGEDSMYPNHPLDMLWQKEKFKGIINIASSPFSDKQRERRGKTLEKVYKHFQVPIVYVNQVGAQTELIFDGGSAVILEDGRMVEGKFFEEGIFYWDTASALTEGFSDYPKKEAIAPVYDALVLGLSDYFKKLGFKKATLGLSGGIDSAVTLAIAADALGSENVYPILLPSEFSSDHSVSDSEKMIQNLGCPFLTIPIKESFDALLNGLRESFAGTEFGLAEENLQARIRGTLLMAVSNKHGHIVLNTSNKSEMAVGFGTLYGDMCGGISVIGDVYKQKVYELARYINRNKETIPQNIIDKAPSAELRPGQLDSDRLPDYEVLDAILELYIEGQQDINAIIKQLKDIDPALIRKTLRLVNINEYKRHQTAPILRVSTKAFGQGRRMPIVAKYLD